MQLSHCALLEAHSSVALGLTNITYSMWTLAAQVKMMHPVIAADGHTYERAAIEQWLKQHNTSPVSRQVLAHKRIVQNIVKSIMGMQG